MSDLGWNSALEESAADHLDRGFIPARVSRQDKHRYQLLSDRGHLTGELSGRFALEHPNAADFPAVGDWVFVSLADAHEGTDANAASQSSTPHTIIHAVAPRQSRFSRKVAGDTTREQIVAANVDVVLLVTGLDNDYNLRRIERYVTLAWNSGARPVVVLNKADLADDIAEVIREVESVAIGIDVIAVSTIGEPGMAPLLRHLVRGQTVALLGSSGVGKSSIVNAIIESDALATTEVRADDSRGRHTTTFRELFVAPSGVLIIDTPGMRELQLWAEEEDVNQTFPEIYELASQCRFADCAHDTEPGCAIQAALDAGTLDPKRYRSYLKLLKEVAFLDRRKAESNHGHRQHEKSLSKLYRSVQKSNRKNKRY